MPGSGSRPKSSRPTGFRSTSWQRPSGSAVSINELAEAFGVSRQSISAVLNGRTSLSADMAIRFEHAFGVKAETLVRMQARYELGKAREHEADLSVPSLIAA